jgi:uncharacterized repeat protein (TIGR01451 family)
VTWLRELNEPGPLFSVTVSNTALSPAFSAAKRATPSGSVQPGEVISYRIVLSNSSVGVARAVVTDTIPTHTTYISMSAGIEISEAPLDGDALPLDVRDVILTPPVYDAANDRLTWQGDIVARTRVTLTFGVTVGLDVEAGTVITNIAWVDELSGPREAVSYSVRNIVGGHRCYLPLVLRDY